MVETVEDITETQIDWNKAVSTYAVSYPLDKMKEHISTLPNNDAKTRYTTQLNSLLSEQRKKAGNETAADWLVLFSFDAGPIAVKSATPEPTVEVTPPTEEPEIDLNAESHKAYYTTSASIASAITLGLQSGDAAASDVSADTQITASKAELAELYETNRDKYWNAIGYDGGIFNQENVTEADLSKDANFLKAAETLYQGLEDEPSNMNPEDLTNWATDRARMYKHNLTLGLIDMGFNAAREQEIQNANKFIVDAYDHKTTTWEDRAKAAGWMIADPINFVPGANIAARGLQATKAVGVVAKTVQFTKATALPSAGVGGIYGAVDSLKVQNIDYHAGAQENMVSGSRTTGDTLVGAAAGGGLSVLGGAVLPSIAPKIAKLAKPATDKLSEALEPLKTRLKSKHRVNDVSKAWEEADIVRTNMNAQTRVNDPKQAKKEAINEDISRVWDEAHAEKAQRERVNDPIEAEKQAYAEQESKLNQKRTQDPSKAEDEAYAQKANMDAANGVASLNPGESFDDFLFRTNSAEAFFNLSNGYQDYLKKQAEAGQDFKIDWINRQDAPSQGPKTTSEGTAPPKSDTPNDTPPEPKTTSEGTTSQNDAPERVELPNVPVNKLPKEADLPKFDPKIDSFKVMTHVWPPRIFPVASMRARSFGITRPVISAIDEKMMGLELAQSIQKMNNDALSTLGTDRNAADIINKFRDDNLTQLAEMNAYLKAMHKHVSETYTTNNTVGWKHDLNDDQKEKLLAYITDMQALTDDLAQGVNGKQGQEILSNLQKLQSGDINLNDLTKSVTGLSKSHMIANNVQTRDTGLLPGTTTPTPLYWKRQLERQIDIGAYNPHSRSENPITFKFLEKNNLERTWQNKLQGFAKRDENGGLKLDFENNVEAKRSFVTTMFSFIDSGFGTDAIFGMEQLARLAQTKGESDKFPFPSVGAIDEAIAAIKRSDLTDEEKLYWDAIKGIVKREYEQGKGAPDVTFLGIKEKWFEDNRPNRHKAERASDFFEMSSRWAGNDRFWWDMGEARAKPGNIFTMARVNFYRNSVFNYVLGAKSIKPGTRSHWGAEEKDFLNPEIVWRDKEGGESAFAVPRRAAVRLLSGGLAKDTVMYVIPNPSKLGWAAIGGASLYGIGEATDQEWLSAPGEFVTDVSLNIAQIGALPISLATSGLYSAASGEEWRPVGFETSEWGIPYPVNNSASIPGWLKSGWDDSPETEEEPAKTEPEEEKSSAKDTPNKKTDPEPENTDEEASIVAEKAGQARDAALDKASSVVDSIKENHESYLGNAWDFVVDGFDWDGDGQKSQSVRSVENGASGASGWISRTFNKMKNNEIQYGRGILSVVGAAIPTFFLANWASKQLGPLGGLLKIAVLVLGIGYGGKAINNMLKGQTSDDAKHTPKAVKSSAVPSVSHTGKSKTSSERIAGTDADGNKLNLVDIDMDNKFAAQLQRKDSDQKAAMAYLTAAPRNVQDIIDSAKAEGRFVTQQQLKDIDGSLVSPESWEFDAISTDSEYKDVIMLRESGAETDMKNWVLDVAEPT